MNVVALDIGGTAIKSGYWNGEALSCVKELPTDAKQGAGHILEKVREIISSYDHFEAIGISTAGQVNTIDGSIYYANENIPGYTGVQLRRILEEEFHVPVSVENDVNAAALGELFFGAAQGIGDFLCVTYGTGVGGAIVIDGKIYGGSTFSGGSFGGIVVHPEDVLPGIDFSGCYEKYASTRSLVQRALEIDPALVNGREIFERKDEPKVAQVIDAWIDEIVLGLVTLVHVFNPKLIVLGGGVMAQEYVLSEINRRIKEIISPGFRDVRLAAAKLKNTAGLMGAVYLCEQRSRVK